MDDFTEMLGQHFTPTCLTPARKTETAYNAKIKYENAVTVKRIKRNIISDKAHNAVAMAEIAVFTNTNKTLLQHQNFKLRRRLAPDIVTTFGSHCQQVHQQRESNQQLQQHCILTKKVATHKPSINTKATLVAASNLKTIAISTTSKMHREVNECMTNKRKVASMSSNKFVPATMSLLKKAANSCQNVLHLCTQQIQHELLQMTNLSAKICNIFELLITTVALKSKTVPQKKFLNKCSTKRQIIAGNCQISAIESSHSKAIVSCYNHSDKSKYLSQQMSIFYLVATIFTFLMLIGAGLVAADQVILLDTTREATLEWTRYPYGPQAQTPGWVEESFTDFVKGINWRSYVVCDVAYHNVNNWLWSPFIDRGPANRLYIEIQFTIRDCSLFPGNALSCKETFSLLFYEFDAATREPPPWQTDSYKLIARIAAGEGRFNQNSDVDINTEVKSIAVTKKGVYFAFRDQGACISVLAVKVYYITCPAVTENFAHFNETPTGREITIIEKQNGTCVDNAEPYESPTYLCKGDGKWTILTGGCRCKVGFEPDYGNKTCNECSIGTFRSHEVGKCIPCPQNSNASKVAAAYCQCLPGFYRHPRDGKHMPCYKPPGPPRNLTLLFVDQTSAILSWNTPLKDVNPDVTISAIKHIGSNRYYSDVVYKVRCISCTTNIVYNPSTDTFNETKLTLTNLEPVTTYTLQIHSMNGISYLMEETEFYLNNSVNGKGLIGGGGENGNAGDAAGGTAENMGLSAADNSASQSGSGSSSNSAGKLTSLNVPLSNMEPIDLSLIKTEYAEIIFTTESAILSTVFNVRVVATTSKEVDLVWDKPVQSDSPIEFYEVRWFPKPELDTINKTALNTKETKAHIEGLIENTEYGFQVRCKTANGYGTYSNIVYAQTHQSVSSVYDDSIQMRIVAGATVAVVVILVLVIVATVLFLRSKHQDDLDKKSSNHLPLPLDYASNEVHAMDTTPIVKTINSNVTTPLFGNSRSYVDPHTYEDPNQAIREFAREIDANYITIEAIIGGGEFGDVCRGRLKIPPNFVQDIDVAIKTLKPGSSEKARCDFLTEASIMGQFDHPNVIYLQGVVTRSNPVMIITEYMENGSLDTFLRVNDGKFQTLQLIVMLRGISSGMAYLSDMNYVHRDLAARNVLVNAQLICKIADFGLSREIENASDAYTTRGGKIPVRWTAPEAIAFRKFTSASDVWSYGVVLWEVMSYGERPYWNWSNQDVIKSIEKGYRLPAPMDCPEALYQLMLDCWQKQRTHRPTFSSIVSTLDNLARQPQALLTTRNSPENDGAHIMDGQRGHNIFISTDLWLENIKMSRYSQHFKEANLVTAQQISRLTAQQLSDMGITLVGHQKKILHQARQLDTII